MCGEARCFLNLTFAIETVSVELEDVAMFPLYTVSFAIIGTALPVLVWHHDDGCPFPR